MRIQCVLIVCLATTVLCGCGRQSSSGNTNLSTNNNSQAMNDFMQQPGAAVTVSGLNFLRDLKDNGRLPGVSTDEHGMLKSGSEDKEAPTGSYPVSRTFYFTKNNDSNQYCYTVVQTSSNSNWQLQKAWRSDASGKVVEEYPVQ